MISFTFLLIQLNGLKSRIVEVEMEWNGRRGEERREGTRRDGKARLGKEKGEGEGS